MEASAQGALPELPLLDGGCCAVAPALPARLAHQPAAVAQLRPGVFGWQQHDALAADAGSYEDVCGFSSFANWLVPGALLVGRYPYVEPSR